MGKRIESSICAILIFLSEKPKGSRADERQSAHTEWQPLTRQPERKREKWRHTREQADTHALGKVGKLVHKVASRLALLDHARHVATTGGVGVSLDTG